MSEYQGLPLYRNMFNLARGLSAGFSVLRDNFSKNGDLIPPAVLCSTFSIEILLKCLQVIHLDNVFVKADLDQLGIRMGSHKYTEIFDQIPERTRHSIAVTYNETTGETISEETFRKKLVELGERNFVDWRYPYETDKPMSLDLVLQDKIADALGKTIEKIIKSKTPTKGLTI